jgi:hypothetical protein
MTLYRRPVDAEYRQRVGLQPQCAGRDRWINASIFPPCGFVATAMGFAMMTAAQGTSVGHVRDKGVLFVPS